MMSSIKFLRPSGFAGQRRRAQACSLVKRHPRRHSCRRQQSAPRSVRHVRLGSLRGWRPNNPCLRVPKLKGGDGWAPWPWHMIEHLREHAALHLWEAAALALYTGQRMSDVLAMLWSDIDQGLIAVVQSKTTKKLWIPIHHELAALLRVLEGRLRKMLGQGGNYTDLRHYQNHSPQHARPTVDARWFPGVMGERTQ